MTHFSFEVIVTKSYAAVDNLLASSIKSRSVPSKVRLSAVVDAVGCDELKIFWNEFMSRQALRSGSDIPDWRTRDQLREFRYTFVRFGYDHNAKGATSETFRAHVVEQLDSYLHEEIEREMAFDRRPWLVRWHSKLGLAILACVMLAGPVYLALLVVDGIFHLKILAAISPVFVVVGAAAWGGYLIFAVFISLWLRLRRRGNNPPATNASSP